MIIIGALGKVCLEQLKKCQQDTDGTFVAASYSRKQLICDMEKWSNRKSYLKISLQLYGLKNLHG